MAVTVLLVSFAVFLRCIVIVVFAFYRSLKCTAKYCKWFEMVLSGRVAAGSEIGLYGFMSGFWQHRNGIVMLGSSVFIFFPVLSDVLYEK